MCTLVLLRRPGSPWPLLLAANRDEMSGRPWRGPGRWWDDRPELVAGLDLLAGGSWLGLNDFGVVAAVLNRQGSLGPDPRKRSRGELVLEALDHADAAEAARALSGLSAAAYRPFNLLVADNRDACWLSNDGRWISLRPVPTGLHMLTALDLDDPASPRVATHLGRFRAAQPPDPGRDEWGDWPALLAAGDGDTQAGREEAAMCFSRLDGFGTVSSALIALPAPGAEARPRWRFAPGPPDRTAFQEVAL
ncbi:NRDE family protein [Phaeospirillum tilakii]|uniref:NRDE family protein n=1 Tax=Phaeospirillum tilakii TaxID=741673 RepID=A0ABW5C8E4_9PROT